MQRVKDIMTPNPRACELDHPITCTLDIMKKENCGAVPVVDADNKLHGIVTDRDIALCLADNPSKTPEHLKVRDCVRHLDQVITVKPDEDMHKAVELMEKHQVRRLLVQDDQMHCVGIVSQADIALKDENSQEAVDLIKEISKEKRTTIGANP